MFDDIFWPLYKPITYLLIVFCTLFDFAFIKTMLKIRNNTSLIVAATISNLITNVFINNNYLGWSLSYRPGIYGPVLVAPFLSFIIQFIIYKIFFKDIDTKNLFLTVTASVFFGDIATAIFLTAIHIGFPGFHI